MKGPIARATLRTSVVLGLRLFVQAGTLLLVARMLGPHDFGAFAGVAALAVMLGTLSTFGTHIVLLAEVSRKPQRRSAVLPFALSTTLICGSLLFGLYLLLATTLLGEAGIGTGVLIALVLAELILQPLLNLPSVGHQGHGRIATSQLLITLQLAYTPLEHAMRLPGSSILPEQALIFFNRACTARACRNGGRV